jgi:hypothetical protein
LAGEFRGGKILFLEQILQGDFECLLVCFDRHEIIGSLVEKNLLGRLHLGVGGVA